MGHCPAYLIAEVKENQVVNSAEVPNPGHGPGGPPPFFLARLGVTHLLGGNAPDRLFGILDQLNIKYTTGVKGDPQEVLAAFLAGTLTTTQQAPLAGCGGSTPEC